MSVACRPITATPGAWCLRTRFIKNTTSQTFTNGSLTFAVGGLATQTSVSAATNPIGIGRKTIGASDAAYSTADWYPLLCPTQGLESRMLMTASGTQTYGAGACCDISDAATANPAANSVKPLFIHRLLSTTLIECAINQRIVV